MDLKKVAQTLERERCSIHNEKPKATAKKESIEIECCCDKFRKKLNDKMRSEMQKQAQEMLKNAFKRK